MFNRPGGFLGGGLMGGLAAGFLGAGLFGLLAGHGFMGGLGGFASFLGLILQVGLVVVIAMFAWRWFQRRNEPATAGGPSLRDMTQNRSGLGNLGLGGGTGGGLGGALGGALGGLGGARASSGPSDDVGIAPADYDTFEQIAELTSSSAYSREDIEKAARLRDAGDGRLFRGRSRGERPPWFDQPRVGREVAAGRPRGSVARRQHGICQRGHAASRWLTRWSTARRTAWWKATIGPQEVTEVWTFVRPRGGNWMLSAIQQA